MVAAIATPNAAPIRRNITVLATEVAVSAASPRTRPTQIEFTEPFRDCRMLANRMGSANRTNPRLIEPSVKERGRCMGTRWVGDEEPQATVTGAEMPQPARSLRWRAGASLAMRRHHSLR